MASPTTDSVTPLPREQALLTTTRLQLRPFQWADKAQVESLVANPILSETTKQCLYPFSNAQVGDWLTSHSKFHKQGLRTTWAIETSGATQPEKQLVGCITLTFSSETNTAEISYWIGHDFWNQGYCSEACNEITRHAFSDLKVNRLTAWVLPENQGSLSVLEKSGLTREGQSQSAIFLNGKYRDAALYGRVNDTVHPPAIATVAPRDIQMLGHPMLRQQATELAPQDIASDATQRLIDEMISTLRYRGALELCAAQFGVPVQLLVIEVSRTTQNTYRPLIPLTVAINPVLRIANAAESASAESANAESGDAKSTSAESANNEFDYFDSCPSVPQLFAKVRRPAAITLRALDRFGKPFSVAVSGVSAALFHHAVEHLQGTLFLDHLDNTENLIAETHYRQQIESGYRFSMQKLKQKYKDPYILQTDTD